MFLFCSYEKRFPDGSQRHRMRWWRGGFGGRKGGCPAAREWCAGPRLGAPAAPSLVRGTAAAAPSQDGQFAAPGLRRRGAEEPPSCPGRMERQRNASRGPAQETAAGASAASGPRAFARRSGGIARCAGVFPGPRLGAPAAPSLGRGSARAPRPTATARSAVEGEPGPSAKSPPKAASETRRPRLLPAARESCAGPRIGAPAAPSLVRGPGAISARCRRRASVAPTWWCPRR
jgi:hypothetical protein